jgi:hypothetical protein
MFQVSVIFCCIPILALASGLVVLWRRGADDLDAWGLFVSRVLRGDRRPARELPRGAAGRYPRAAQPTDPVTTAAEPDPDGLHAPARTASGICPGAAGNSRTHRDTTGHHPAKSNSP